MIKVKRAKEPASFNGVVRVKGLAWIAKKGLTGVATAPTGLKLPAYWKDALGDLMTSYESLCAYSGFRIHEVSGARSADHFAPKSKALSKAYEWLNYRLTCSLMNARKNAFTDLLDPFLVVDGSFILNAADGSITLSPSLNGKRRTKAEKTIERLQLDGPVLRRVRLRDIDEYLKGDMSAAKLKRESRYVWFELDRQGIKP